MVRVMLGDYCFTVAYAFLEDKATSGYSHVLAQLKRAAPLWTPTNFVLDFETGKLLLLFKAFPPFN